MRSGLRPFIESEDSLDDVATFAAVSDAMENTTMLGGTGSIDLKEFVRELLNQPLPSASQVAANAFLQSCPLLELETTDHVAGARTLSIYAPRPERFDPAYITMRNQLPLNLGIWSLFLADYYRRILGKTAPGHPLLQAIQATMQDEINRGIYRPRH